MTVSGAGVASGGGGAGGGAGGDRGRGGASMRGSSTGRACASLARLLAFFCSCSRSRSKRSRSCSSMQREHKEGGGSQQGPSTPVLTSPLTLAPSVLSDTPAQRETPQIAYQSSQAQGKAPGAQQ